MAPRRKSPALQRPAPDHNPKAEAGDNSAAMEEAERVQLISFIGRATTAAGEVTKTKAPYDAAKKGLNQVFTLARAANPEFTRKYLEKKMDEMNRMPGENARLKAMESRHDKWLGILTPEQQKMHLEPGTPVEVKDEMDWRMRGYSQGLQGRKAKLPEGIPPRMDQPFLAGHGDGFAVYTEALNGQSRQPSKPVGEQAEEDFKADNPEVDVDAEARRLAKDPAFMARGAGEIVDGNPLGAEAQGQVPTQPAAEAPFEATPEELAAQKPRQAAKARREAAEAAAAPGADEAVV